MDATTHQVQHERAAAQEVLELREQLRQRAKPERLVRLRDEPAERHAEHHVLVGADAARDGGELGVEVCATQVHDSEPRRAGARVHAGELREEALAKGDDLAEVHRSKRG